MAQYLVLLYEDEDWWSDLEKPEAQQALKEHVAFKEAHGRGKPAGWLHPTDTATSIRKDATGGFVVTDGPFVETKEALGGYYVIEAGDLDEAIEIAKQIPAPAGGVEVRPLRRASV